MDFEMWISNWNQTLKSIYYISNKCIGDLDFNFLCDADDMLPF